jgi:hypothetical protein
VRSSSGCDHSDAARARRQGSSLWRDKTIESTLRKHTPGRARTAPGAGPRLGNKTGFVFRRAPSRTLVPCRPPRPGRRRARVRTRRYLWTVQAPRPACTVAVFHHLRGRICFLLQIPPPPQHRHMGHGYTPESYILLLIITDSSLPPSTPPALSPSGQTQIDHSDRPCPPVCLSTSCVHFAGASHLGAASYHPTHAWGQLQAEARRLSRHYRLLSNKAVNTVTDRFIREATAHGLGH